jgi:hypothetical protein
VRLIRYRRYRRTWARIRALELELGIVENTARHRAELRQAQGKQRRRYMAANVPVSAMGPLPDVLTRPGLGQKSPRGTVRPPVLTTQQVTPPPPSVHHHCGHCDCP